MRIQRFLFLLVALCSIHQVQAQKKVEDLAYYEASNGVIYKKGDKIKLSHGAGDFGVFRSVSLGKGYVTGNEPGYFLGSYSGYIFTITAVKRYNMKKFQGVMFYLSGIPILGTCINIESAIEKCEIYNCKKGQEDFVFDESYKSKDKYEKRDEYVASNGVTYKVGDEIELIKGSSRKGDFAFLADSKNGIMEHEETSHSKGKRMGEIVLIEKIKKYNTKTLEGVYFSVKVKGRPFNSILDIEGALYSCEIGDCIKNEEAVMPTTIVEDNKATIAPTTTTTTTPPVSSDDKYDQLRKIKKLYDEGVLTEEEFTAEKKKILNNE